MELMVWLMGFDKRLLCGLQDAYFSYVYIWLLPVLVAVVVLALTYLSQTTRGAGVSGLCFQDEASAGYGFGLKQLVFIQ